MKILTLIANPCINDGRVIKAAETFAAAGHAVTVFALAAAGVPDDELRHGVQYRRMPHDRDRLGPLPWLAAVLPPSSWFYRGVRFVLYSLFRYRWYRQLVQARGAAWRPDLVHAHDIETVPAALAIARQTGAAVIYDAHELETDRNPRPRWFVRLRLAAVLQHCLRRVDHVVTVGEEIASRLRRLAPAASISCVFNVPRVRACPRQLRQDCGLAAGVPLAVYSGKVTSGRGLELILDALPALPALHLAIVGPCDDEWARRLDGWTAARGLQGRVHRLAPVGFDEVVDYIQAADLGLLSVEPLTTSYQYSMPNKLFEMAFAGLPLVCNELPEAGSLIERHQLGQVVNYGDTARLAEVIGTVLLRGRRGAPAEFLVDWGWPRQEQALLAAAEAALARRQCQHRQ